MRIHSRWHPHLATTSFNGTLRIWNPTTGTCLRALPVCSHGVWAVCAFAIDGTPHLATGGDDDIIQIWNPATGTHVRTLTGHDHPVADICAFTLHGRTYLATASNDSTAPDLGRRHRHPSTHPHQP